MSFSTNPSYKDLVSDLYRTIKWFYREEHWTNYTFPQSFYDDFRKYFTFPLNDYLIILLIGILITIFRYSFDIFICKALLDNLNLDHKSNRSKFSESAWKFFIYSLTWLYTANLLLFNGKYDYFTRPWFIWDDWALNMEIPFDITFIYFVECGFYLHSVYGTIFMDSWRRDSLVMLLHHFLTMALIIVSYGTRYHKIGLLVLFVHDVTDILLEFTKLNVYLKHRNKKVYKIHEYASNIGFAVFTFAWYVFRLYWFPLKVLYTTGVTAVYRAYYRGAGLYAFFNILLWILMLLDIYWFYFILLFLYKVATGQVKEINDTREYDDEDDDHKKNVDEKKKE